MQNEIVELYLDDIIPNRFQPREKFDEEALQELSTSIKEHGVIQPIIVRKIGEKYEIIAGERRYKASALAGLTKIPAIIRNLDDKEASKVALLENLQRKDLTAIEEARTYQKILELDSMTQEELGRTMGKSQAAIANKLRLLALTDEVQEALLNDQISERHARSLLTIENANEQVEMLNRVIRGRMTVRELDNEIRNAKLRTQETLPIEAELEVAPQKEEIIAIPKLEDIIKPVTPLTPIERQNIDLSSRKTEEQPRKEDIFAPFKKEGQSIDNFKVPNMSPIMIDEELEKTVPEYKNEPVNETNNTFFEQFKLKDAINAVRGIVPSLRDKGMKVSVEETDLGGKYQIIINIDKDS